MGSRRQPLQKLRLCWRSAAMLGATMWPFLLAVFIPASLAAPPLIPDPTTTTTTTTTTTEVPTTTSAPVTTEAPKITTEVPLATTTVAATTFAPQSFTTQQPTLDTTHVPVTVAPQKQEEPVSTRIPGSERRALLLRLDLATLTAVLEKQIRERQRQLEASRQQQSRQR